MRLIQEFELGMSVQNNIIRRYIELSPAAVTWFRMFGAKNYANACAVFSLQWSEWQISQNPIVGFLDLSFKACSEEHGVSRPYFDDPYQTVELHWAEHEEYLAGIDNGE